MAIFSRVGSDPDQKPTRICNPWCIYAFPTPLVPLSTLTQWEKGKPDLSEKTVCNGISLWYGSSIQHANKFRNSQHFNFHKVLYHIYSNFEIQIQKFLSWVIKLSRGTIF